MTGQGLRDRLFAFANRIPLVREATDPMVFLFLTALVMATTLGVLFAEDVFPGDEDARGHVLQVAGGLLLVLAAYFTSINLREARAQHAFDRLGRAIEQLGSDSEAVRNGAIKLLLSLAFERLELPSATRGMAATARQEAIREALESVAREADGTRSADLAHQALQKLETQEPRY